MNDIQYDHLYPICLSETTSDGFVPQLPVCDQHATPATFHDTSDTSDTTFPWLLKDTTSAMK